MQKQACMSLKSEALNALLLVVQIGVPPDQVRLIFAGRCLELHRTPADYGLKCDNTVHAILRLVGD